MGEIFDGVGVVESLCEVAIVGGGHEVCGVGVGNKFVGQTRNNFWLDELFVGVLSSF